MFSLKNWLTVLFAAGLSLCLAAPSCFPISPTPTGSGGTPAGGEPSLLGDRRRRAETWPVAEQPSLPSPRLSATPPASSNRALRCR